jgi:hypothetical protein
MELERCKSKCRCRAIRSVEILGPYSVRIVLEECQNSVQKGVRMVSEWGQNAVKLVSECCHKSVRRRVQGSAIRGVEILRPETIKVPAVIKMVFRWSYNGIK